MQINRGAFRHSIVSVSTSTLGILAINPEAHNLDIHSLITCRTMYEFRVKDKLQSQKTLRVARACNILSALLADVLRLVCSCNHTVYLWLSVQQNGKTNKSFIWFHMYKLAQTMFSQIFCIYCTKYFNRHVKFENAGLFSRKNKTWPASWQHHSGCQPGWWKNPLPFLHLYALITL